MANEPITMIAVGDVWVNRPDPKSAFAFVAPVLQSGDITFGNGEAIYTRRGINQFSMVENQPNDPDNIEGLAYAGFDVMNLAQNHIFDWGVTGVEDTINGIKERGIAVFGAGLNIDEARKPAILERNGIRFGFLGYWCGDPKEAWATTAKPGAAYVRILTHFEPPALTGCPPEEFTFADPASLELMLEDIRKLRPNCDVLVLSLHKGIVHTPVRLSMFEQQISYAAIDAGVDLILGHHAHILRGIEFYRGKPIIHSMCNFIFDWELSKEPSAAAQAWAEKRKKYFGFEPDPNVPTYPFHPEAFQTIIVKIIFEGNKITRVSYYPCLINKTGQPELLKHDERGQKVFDYMERITREAGLNAKYAWDGDEILVK